MSTLLAVARQAMNTRFEILLAGEDPVRLRAAGEEALDEVERLEEQLSLFRPTSEISRLNQFGAREPVPLSLPVFELLQQARQLWAETGGAFDPTLAPLLRCWGLLGNRRGQVPSPDQLSAAKAQTGMHLLDFHESDHAVSFQRDGVMLDLGAIGKGYAIDCAVEVLQEAGVTNAFLHGGTSSCYGLGHPPDAATWKAGVRQPVFSDPTADESNRPAILAEVPLLDESLGVSATDGKFFRMGDRVYGHVLDPRSGEPAQGAWLAAVVLPSATESDAFSTALLTWGEEGLLKLSAARPDARALLMLPSADSTPPRLLSKNVTTRP